LVFHGRDGGQLRWGAFAIIAAGALVVGFVRRRLSSVVTAKRIIGAEWTPPAAASPYLLTIEAAEGEHAIPKHLLARLLYQESRFRADVINGSIVSPAGAVGIAQIVPKWHPNVNPLDPIASIHYAANYLASLKRQFGTWEEALAAYNWGPGNLEIARAKADEQWLAIAPLETRKYVAEITADVRILA
jgi:soluble lytic murein transglycosylase-like protein